MTRRGAIVLAATTGAGVATAAPRLARGVEAASTLRIGLVGCGGRGVGAAVQAVAAGRACLPGRVTIAAIGDLFDDAVDDARSLLASALGRSPASEGLRSFSGSDAFERVVAEPIDAVILATPPCYRPAQVRAAVERGLHVYAERPLAIDPAGVAEVEEAGRLAADRGLSFVTSLSLRYDPAIADAVDRRTAEGRGRPRTAVASEPRPGLWSRDASSCPPARRPIRNWIADPALSGGLFLDRCFDAVDLGMMLVGASPGGVADAAADAVEYRDGEGRGVRVEFSGGRPQGSLAVEGDAGDRLVVSPGIRRRAAAGGFASAWTAFLLSIRHGRPFNDAAAACRANRVAIAMARASERLPGIARPSFTASS